MAWQIFTDNLSIHGEAVLQHDSEQVLSPNHVPTALIPPPLVHDVPMSMQKQAQHHQHTLEVAGLRDVNHCTPKSERCNPRPAIVIMVISILVLYMALIRG
ncbi:hypothetical protein HN51_067027 [Arachis hypogaea]|nr:uncharacterized protein DS421_14g472510 [Arachis hypogaea]